MIRKFYSAALALMAAALLAAQPAYRCALSPEAAQHARKIADSIGTVRLTSNRAMTTPPRCLCDEIKTDEQTPGRYFVPGQASGFVLNPMPSCKRIVSENKLPFAVSRPLE